MNDLIDNQWFQYLETPRGQGGPVKLDQILAERLKTFLRARQVKPFPTEKP